MKRYGMAPLPIVLFLLCLPPAFSAPQQEKAAELRYPAAEAEKHVGEIATVCGKVASAKYASSSRGQPTFINLDKPYPNHIFTVVIWGEDRMKFGKPEKELLDRPICVTGTISTYRGKPQIVAKTPSQIEARAR